MSHARERAANGGVEEYKLRECYSWEFPLIFFPAHLVRVALCTASAGLYQARNLLFFRFRSIQLKPFSFAPLPVCVCASSQGGIDIDCCNFEDSAVVTY